jgi:hypothetical protein
MAGNKYLSNSAGAVTEVAAIQTSAGAGDVGKIPALDAAGKLDTSMIPGGAGGDVVGPATHAASYVPQWNTTPNSKTLVEGLAVGTAANNLVQLNGSGALPAVSGANLTNLPAGGGGNVYVAFCL